MIHEWLLWRKCFQALQEIVDGIYLRIDEDNCSDTFISTVMDENLFPKVRVANIMPHNFHAQIWREGLLRMLDKVRPDVVIALDDDEIFDERILREIGAFWKSDKKAMMCSYNPCIPVDGRKLPVYPSRPHMKVFKWSAGLSFNPYKGFAQVTQYANQKRLYWMCETKINHFCMFTPDMEKAKRQEIQERYAGI